MSASEMPRMDPRFLVLHKKQPVTYRDGLLLLDAETDLPVVADDDNALTPDDEIVDHSFNNERHYYLHGLNKPTLFKTLKMARKAVRDGYTWVKKKDAGKERTGKILLFDVDYLPEINADDPVFERPGFADTLSELELCERQSQLWAERAAAIASGKRMVARRPT